jgi:quercetin dioxygenase-like cupin family protein
MQIIKGGRAGQASQQRTDTFTGTVFGDVVMGQSDGVAINSVSFAPGARTHWHHHDAGQVLIVTSGAGYVFDRDGKGGPNTVGDVVFIPPDEEHWHGAGPDTFMVHLAISLKHNEWLEPVTDEQYRGAIDGAGA